MGQPNLMRPNQVQETKDEIRRLETLLQRTDIQDRGEAMRQHRDLNYMLETQAPKPYADGEKDVAVRRAAELKNQILQGMPTQAEMRRAPSGSVGKHIDWEKRNKAKLREWKNIMLRLNHDTSDPDVANFERFRPTTASHELNMDNQLVETKDYHLPPPGAAPTVVFDDQMLAELQELSPEIYGKLIALPNELRAEVADLVLKARAEKQTEKPKAKAKSPMSEEQRKAVGKRLAEARAKKKAEKEQT